MAESRDTNGQNFTENQNTGRLEENQAASQERKKGTKAPGKKDQGEKEKRIVRMAEQWLKQAKIARGRFDTNWVSQVRYIEGKQWTERRPSYRHSEVLNLTHAAVQTIIPILTDNRHNIETLPEEPSDFEFSEILTQILRSKWDRRLFGQVVAEGILDMAGYGTVVSKQEWNAEIDFGLGDFEFETVDPLYCYPDPNARNVNDKDSQRFQTAVPTDVAEVKRKYPKWAHLLKPNVGEEPLAKTARTEVEDDYRVQAVSDYNVLLQSSKPMEGDERNQQILLVTTYCKSEEVEEFEIKEKDEKGNEVTKFQTRKKYPNGRKIVHANGVLLEDGDNPYIDGKFPFARAQDHIRAREFWGMGEVEQLRGPQDMVNKVMSYVMDVLILMGNPIWVCDTSSGVDTDNLINAPGLVIEKNEGSEVRRESGVQLQPFILQTLDRLVELFEKISGINDVSQGAQPRNASGIAIELLQEAAQTKLRLKSRNIEAWLTEVGQQFVSRILQYYTIPRVIRLTGDDNAGRFFKVAIDEQIDESGEATRVLQLQEFERTEEGELITGEPRELQLKGNLDVKIRTGTALPFAKAQREAQANRLLEMGIYDEEDYLEDIQHPRKDKVLEKFNQRKQQQAQLAQADAQFAQNNALEMENVKSINQEGPIGPTRLA
jgi:hypothetical protein